MAASAVIFGCEGPHLSPDEVAFFKEADPWGFILFLRNLEAPDQIRKLCDDLRNSVGREAPILIDQEGGRVARLRPPLASDWPNPKDHVAGLTADVASEVMYLRYRIIAEELLSYGIDVNCAPMLDVPLPSTHDIIADRVYADDPALVAQLGRAVMSGLLDGGVLPIIKHIPGHGRANIDSHLDLPRVDADAAALQADFAPFKDLSDAPMAMTGHVLFEAYDPENCATMSSIMVDLIRTNIGFDGLLMTDDLSMKALKGGFKERVTGALSAGCDMILHCNGVMDEMQQVISQTPMLSGQAQNRADAALAARRPAQPFDAEEARMRLRDLLQTRNA
ncbi:MAG: glycoside hydrolase family 3 protein [Pseudomonadota bacterium]